MQYNPFSSLPVPEAYQGVLFVALLLWSLAWKGFALWHAAVNKQKYWFVVLLVLNTMGILPLVFLCFYSKTPLIKRK